MNMLNPLYWFSLQPANVDGLLGNLLFGFILLLFLAGVVCRIVIMNKKQDHYVKMIGKRLITLCLTMGFLGVMMYFFSYEGIQLFGARFWYPMWVLGFVVWGTFITRFALKEIPALREKNLRQHAKSKYIPGRKR